MYHQGLARSLNNLWALTLPSMCWWFQPRVHRHVKSSMSWGEDIFPVKPASASQFSHLSFWLHPGLWPLNWKLYTPPLTLVPLPVLSLCESSFSPLKASPDPPPGSLPCSLPGPGFSLHLGPSTWHSAHCIRTVASKKLWASPGQGACPRPCTPLVTHTL